MRCDVKLKVSLLISNGRDMIKNRYIHSRRETPYRIHIEERNVDEDLVVNIYGIDENLIGAYHFDAVQLNGKNSIHFKYIDDSICWCGGISPKQK